MVGGATYIKCQTILSYKVCLFKTLQGLLLIYRYTYLFLLLYVFIFDILNIILGYRIQLIVIKHRARNHITEKTAGLKFCNALFYFP